ncbi:HD domain-containing protein [Nonomuraea sp. NPDC050783]|uniref:HD domain-containing protein n=1 Tax=Nonomuraea sp. NPDC050783 TaxID=3154634 RepID=UPI003465732E
MICAALLHDVLEDTGCPEPELAAAFGETVVRLVRGVSALDDPERLPPDWRDTTDERVLAIKLADRLHNLRTARFLPEDKRRRKARETLELFVPVAGRARLEPVGRELQRLSAANLPGRGSFALIAAGAVLLPPGARARYVEEWLGELHALPGPRARARFALQLVAGMPRMAATLRRGNAPRVLRRGNVPRVPRREDVSRVLRRARALRGRIGGGGGGGRG